MDGLRMGALPGGGPDRGGAPAARAPLTLAGRPPWRRLGRWHLEGLVYDEGRALLRRADGTVLVPRPKTEIVLQVLLRHAGVTVPRALLLDAAWPEQAVCDDNLTQCVVEIRRALGVEGAALRTVKRRGYRMDAAVRWEPSG